jgi:hypothetical protein
MRNDIILATMVSNSGRMLLPNEIAVGYCAAGTVEVLTTVSNGDRRLSV